MASSGKRQEPDRKFRQNIGKKGGDATALRGSEYFSEIGKKGGDATALRGSEYFSEIGKKGGKAKKKKREEQRGG